jgi:hypothetical protein
MATIEARKTPDGKNGYRVKIRLRGFPPQTATFDLSFVQDKICDCK